MTSLAKIGARLLGGVLHRAEQLGVGDLSQILRIQLADGRTAVVKGSAAPPIEAAMLEVIAKTGAPAPKVLAFNEEALVIEPVAAQGALAQSWRDLATVLVKLHEAQGPSYGWARDYAFGPVAIRNAWMANRPAFWAERRLMCHSRHESLRRPCCTAIFGAETF